MHSYSNKITLILMFLLISLVACTKTVETNNVNTSINIESNNVTNEENSSVISPDNPPVEKESTANVRIDFDLTSIPIMDDATNYAFGDEGVFSFQTQHTTEEILEFYKTEMANIGFSQGYEIVVADKIVILFEKGGFPIVITTSFDGSGGYFVFVGTVD